MERLVYGARINGRWCFVVNSATALTAFEGDTTTMDAECACGQNGMTLLQQRTGDWAMVCTDCLAVYPIALMPARQCTGGLWTQYPAEMAG